QRSRTLLLCLFVFSLAVVLSPYRGHTTVQCPGPFSMNAAIGKLVLQRGATEGKLKTTKTGLRGGTCKEMTGDYELTGTPGRFFYHIEKWGADVDAYVVHTNYIEYAIVIMSKAKSTGDKSTAVKLYSEMNANISSPLNLPLLNLTDSVLFRSNQDCKSHCAGRLQDTGQRTGNE
uniref:Lipocalin/cytosolic fatty-acid binding domain-containing protein n=1 Tax=Amphiprion ocellaris TaxID=80972 RepID=A0AAQ5XEL2_AMPOC